MEEEGRKRKKQLIIIDFFSNTKDQIFLTVFNQSQIITTARNYNKNTTLKYLLDPSDKEKKHETHQKENKVRFGPKHLPVRISETVLFCVENLSNVFSAERQFNNVKIQKP